MAEKRARPSYQVVQSTQQHQQQQQKSHETSPSTTPRRPLSRQGSSLLKRSGSSLRISVCGPEVREIAEEPQATLVDFFLSGRSQSSLRAQDSGDLGSIEDSLDVELIVDPPCVAPMDEEDDGKGVRRSDVRGTAPAEYWKSFATWKQDDPSLAEQRARACKFVQTWTKKNGLEELMKGATYGSASELKKGRSRTRSLFRMRSEGNLDVYEGFVNISRFQIGIRKITSAAEEQKTGEVVQPGEPVCVERVVEKDDTRWFKLADGRGWVFDQTGGVTVMAKMEEVELGDVWYRVACKDLVDVRRMPVYDEEARTGRLMGPKECTVVNIKCRVRGQTFLHLADGRGWMFVAKPTSSKKDRVLGDIVMEECDAQLIHGENWMMQEDLLPVTTDIVEVGLWTYAVSVDDILALGTKLHGVVLHRGDILKVDKRCYAAGTRPSPGGTGRKWLHLIDGRGWIPEMTIDEKAAVTLKSGGGLSYPVTLKGKQVDEASKLPGWAIGIC